MRCPILVGKVKLHLRSGSLFVHQPFDFLFPVVGNAVQRIADAMRHSGFPGAVVPGDIADIAEGVALRGLVIAEIGKGNAFDFHSGDLFHAVSPL